LQRNLKNITSESTKLFCLKTLNQPICCSSRPMPVETKLIHELPSNIAGVVSFATIFRISKEQKN